MADPSRGWFGYDYRSTIGLHRSSGGGTTDTEGPLWDLFVGPLPFLFATTAQDPYVRETAPVSKQRMDTSRDPGDVSLDSGMWLRGQTSWHLGAGQEYSEPLEGAPDEARFRFASSGGVDVCTPGQVSMIHTSLPRATATRTACLGVSNGVLVPMSTGVMRYPESGSPVTVSAQTDVDMIVASDTQWFGRSSAGAGIRYGNLAGGSEGVTALAGITTMAWAKDRLWVGAGHNLYEITSLSPPTLPGSPITFRGGVVQAIATGAGALYVMVVGTTTSIFALTSDDSGVLSAPREVATLPHGENGFCLYGYLGRYLAIGTTKGVRIADCSDSGSLALGPLTVETTWGCHGIVGHDRFLYVTCGIERIKPNLSGDQRPGLYRIDLSRPLGTGNDAAARFPYAADLYAPGTGTLPGIGWSVTVFNERIWYTAGDFAGPFTLYRQDDDYSTSGWLDSGLVSFSTAERKAWLSIGIDVTGAGSVYLEANDGSGWQSVTSSVISVPRQDPALAIDSMAIPPGTSLRHRITLTGDGSAAGSPTLQSLGLRATPVPRRTRYFQLSLMCFDFQRDRNNTPVGYEGFAYDRISDLESLEEMGALVTLLDGRTGEGKRCVIDKVSFASTSPPSKRFDGFGGVVTLTLLSV